MVVMIGLVFLIVDRGFKANLLRACDDDLRAIRSAYVTAQPATRALHEASEMIEDRTVAADTQVQLLLEVGAQHKVAGNMTPQAPRSGEVHLRYPRVAGAPEREILGRGLYLAPGVYAFAGRDLAEVRRSEFEILVAFAAVLLGSVVLAAASGLWLSGRYLGRIDAISDTCRAIMAGDLRERVAPRGDGELARLAATVNAMLDRIQTLMENVRQVSDDIAHDLRTPLTHLRSSLERALAEPRSQTDYEQALQQAITDADQLLEIFSALLRIARIEAGRRRDGFRSFDLGEVLTQAVAMYRPLMEDAAHPVRLAVQPGIVVQGDPQLALQLVANLLDNAIHHTPAGTGVSAWAGLQDGRPTLIVADTGPGVPEADVELVLRRFYRLEKSRTSPGHGLGLSMVAAIVELHDGRLELSDNGPGLRVTVQLPPPAAGHRPARATSPTLIFANISSPARHATEAQASRHRP